MGQVLSIDASYGYQVKTLKNDHTNFFTWSGEKENIWYKTLSFLAEPPSPANNRGAFRFSDSDYEKFKSLPQMWLFSTLMLFLDFGCVWKDPLIYLHFLVFGLCHMVFLVLLLLFYPCNQGPASSFSQKGEVFSLTWGRGSVGLEHYDTNINFSRKSGKIVKL